MNGLSGIYRIDGPNGKFYIGSAKDIRKRWAGHTTRLRRGTHPNAKLQSAWDKHGEQAFCFSVLEEVRQHDQLLAREQFWLDRLMPAVNGYNILIVADRRTGLKASEETKRKQSEAHKGRKHGPMSDQQKQLLSSILIGRQLPQETRKKMAESRTGRKLSEETKKKIAMAQAGRPKSAEHRAKLAQAKLGKRQSQEHVQARVRGVREARLNRQTALAA